MVRDILPGCLTVKKIVPSAIRGVVTLLNAPDLVNA